MAVLEVTLAHIDIYVGAHDETVRIADVELDRIETPGFQRDRKAAHIDKIAGEYDQTAYIFPIVALFRDHFICIDGQQRLAALEKLDKDTATVLVIEGVAKPERLADIFLKVNRDRKLLNALEKYIGALSSKDRGTVDVEQITREFGLEVSKSASAGGKVPAGAVTTIHTIGGNDLLARVYKIRQQAWGENPSREANEGKTLLGVARFLKRYWDNIDDQHLIDVLSRHHPGYILQAIDKRRGMSQTMTYSDYVREQYNKGRRGKSKL